MISSREVHSYVNVKVLEANNYSFEILGDFKYLE